ncbi:rhodanese-related sulfurtransferase [Fluviispira multicolorata]|uniref:tRNA uridine(34) hydroxylase n=1 Tax=Fluviispira multicolorata TaxID=2654512 RepID=A0A833JE31_9BACT|nr:rhodanese-related sulfurtransferase [Fluviispira multicolorata]KAB8032188.1 rhodanese-related sulfurtransferase [Fluviispira multicolorata]
MTSTCLSASHPYVNIAYYKFVEIENLESFRETLLSFCNKLNIKGTILLAHEGINSCLVGSDDSIQQYIDYMHADSRFADIEFKKSYSDHIPFRRMIIKVKKEIIPMGMDSIKPAHFTGKYVEALELKKWLDDGEDLVILDTRNDYEVDLGTFRGAIDPRLKQFRDFPQWIKSNFAEHKNKKVVTFCTGGIRCEKATAFMRQEGFEEVYQLQGGILKYFEETANRASNEDNYYDGDCFVFDYRVAVDKKLNEAKYEICYACWSPLKPEDLTSSQYKKDHHCPHCFEKHLERESKRSEIMRMNNMKALQVRQERAKEVRAKWEKEKQEST